MTRDELVHAYRLLDATLGQLEVSMGVQHELRLLRRATVRMRLASIQTPLTICLLTLVGIVPTLFAVIPEQWSNAWYIWPSALALAAIIGIILLVDQLVENAEERAEIDALMPEQRPQSLESDYSYILMQISACGTRLSAIRAVLGDAALDSTTKQKFEGAKAHFEAKLAEIDNWVSTITPTVLSSEQADTARNWISVARQSSKAA